MYYVFKLNHDFFGGGKRNCSIFELNLLHNLNFASNLANEYLQLITVSSTKVEFCSDR